MIGPERLILEWDSLLNEKIMTAFFSVIFRALKKDRPFPNGLPLGPSTNLVICHAVVWHNGT